MFSRQKYVKNSIQNYNKSLNNVKIFSIRQQQGLPMRLEKFRLIESNFFNFTRLISKNLSQNSKGKQNQFKKIILYNRVVNWRLKRYLKFLESFKRFRITSLKSNENLSRGKVKTTSMSFNNQRLTGLGKFSNLAINVKRDRAFLKTNRTKKSVSAFLLGRSFFRLNLTYSTNNIFIHLTNSVGQTIHGPIKPSMYGVKVNKRNKKHTFEELLRFFTRSFYTLENNIKQKIEQYSKKIRFR